MSDERRRYVRVNAGCPIVYREIMDSELGDEVDDDQFDPVAAIDTHGIVGHLRSGGDQQNDQMMELLLWIDWKMNYLIRTLAEERKGSAFPYRAEMADLSAAGLRFSSTKENPEGNLLEFRFFLPILPFKELSITGLVTRSAKKRQRKPGEQYFETGVRFEGMKESEQELLFSYVVKRERQIRNAQREREIPH